MRSHVRVVLLALVTGALIAVAAPAAQADFGIGSFFAANCNKTHPNCKKPALESEELVKAEEEGFTQASGHPPFGVTEFTVKTKQVEYEAGKFVTAPEGVVKAIRTDVAPGLATSPYAVPQCTMAEFGTEVAPETFLEPECESDTELGVNKVVVYVEAAHLDLPLEGEVYNLVPEEKLASEYGVAIELPSFLTKGVPGLWVHTLIKGSVEWGAETAGTGKADYHDYFKIAVSPALPLITSRLSFEGTKGGFGKGTFITNSSNCNGSHTTYLTLESEAGEIAREHYTTPIGIQGCKGEAPFEAVPFEPAFSIGQSSTAGDTVDALKTEFSLPHTTGVEETDSSQVKSATITLPPGLTLNSAAGQGLEDCTPAEFGLENGIATDAPIDCPESSELGTVSLDVPTLPPGSLTGHVYLGGPPSGPITGPPYILYVAAESERYGVVVRLEGQTTANAETGQLTTTFASPPEQPFSDLVVHFNGGSLAPLANGLTCETGTAATSFTPFTGTEAKSPSYPFTISDCGSASSFAIAQSTENQNSTGGGNTSYVFNLVRPAGQQYLKTITTTLPEGLIGAIPAVTPCEEPKAAAGTCEASARIGTATVTAGAGGLPATFKGPVYLTGPYDGAPYGLDIPVEAASGPFDLGLVNTRATININQTTARVTTAATLETIKQGVPLRIRSISVDVNKQGFLYNPTNCRAEATETTLTSLEGSTQTGLDSPFQLTGCSSLKFAPTVSASTSAKFSKKDGASLTTMITMPAGDANIQSVKVQLPLQMPSRTSTLNHACLAATFEANPYSCPALSKVGTAEVITPTLPGKLTGPAIFVSHGGAAFPDLDLVLEDKGVKIILVGNTLIKNKITTTTFAQNPDAPIESVKVSLPSGTDSAVGPYGDLCAKPLVMPTTIGSQSGATFKKNVTISISGCAVKIIGHKVAGSKLYLTIKTFSPGRVSVSGAGVGTVYHSYANAKGKAAIVVSLSPKGKARNKPLKTKIRVGFVPKTKGAHSSTSVKVTFR